VTQKLLLIDDCESVHALLKVRLRREDVEVHTASGGEEGIALAKSLRPDLILLDVDMPGLDGYEVCRRLKQDPETMQLPVIFLSGQTTTDQKIRGLELGATDYIAKPFEPAELQARVRAALRTKYLIDLLAQRAQIDGLTGSWNRQYLDARLASELSLCRRTSRPLSCLMLDIDRFKHINDTYGHPFGDVVIRAVAQAVTAAVRTEDVVCRYGGEEFAILLPNTTASAALALGERLRQAVAGLVLRCDHDDVTVTCSVGVANLVAEPAPSILELADRALYEAKRGGRNRVVEAA
jgi:two-component system, cell cycle response regulator